MTRRIEAAVILLLIVAHITGCGRKQLECPNSMAVRLTRLDERDERKLKQARMREFVWEHWRAGKCAELLETYITLEGGRTDTTYEMKRTGFGARLLRPAKTVMVVTTKRAGYGYNGQVFWHPVKVYEVYTVERFRSNNCYAHTPDFEVEILPESMAISSSDYCLRFRGWGGEVEGFL